MTDLATKTPAHGLLPVEVDGCVLTEVDLQAITWIAPFKGQQASVSAAMQEALGCSFPEPNRLVSTKTIRVMSTGPQEALILGGSIDVAGAAIVDQTDGWTVLRLSGEVSADVLARLTSVDLRSGVFQVGHTARTMIGHMTGSVTRLEDAVWEVMVFRSMARTAVHEVHRAMTAVAARRTL